MLYDGGIMNFARTAKYMLQAAILGLVSLCATQALATGSKADEMKIAVVDQSQVFQSLPQRETVAKKLKEEFAQREKELNQMIQEDEKLREKQQKEANFMSEQDKISLQRKRQELNEVYTLKRNAFSEDMGRREREEGEKIMSIIHETVKHVAQEQHLALVVEKRSAVFVADHVPDISNAVIDKISQTQK